MNVGERVHASRLINRIDNNESYSRQIGLSYQFIMAKKALNTIHDTLKEEKNNKTQSRDT